MDWQMLLVYLVVVITAFCIVRWIVGIVRHSNQQKNVCPGCKGCAHPLAESNPQKEHSEKEKS